MILEDSAYSKSFEPIIYSWDRYIIAYGGRGSSKTDTFYLKYILALFEPYYFRLAYINKEKANIRDQQYAGFKRVAKRIGVYDRLRFFDGDYRIINPENGNSLIPKGMDDPEKTKGMDDITAIWWDEINKGKLEDFNSLNALLRSPQAKYLQFAISFNPVSEMHWLRDYFFDKNDAYKLHDNFKSSALLHHSTYKDNEFIDQEAYYATLLQNAQGNTNRMLVDIKGLWGVEKIENPFFYAFNEDLHYTDERYQLAENTQIILSFDFNNNPTTLLIGQVDVKRIAIFDLILADENTISGLSPLEAVCHKFKAKYLDSGLLVPAYVLVTGDATGKNKTADNVSNKGFYSKIKQLLSLGDSQIKIRKQNPTHILSRELSNGLLYNTDFTIYRSAKLLCNGLNIAYADNNGSLNEAKKKYEKDGDSTFHIVDTFRYFCDCVLNFEKWSDYLLYYSKK